MSRYRKNKSLDVPPAFDLARQARHPAILFILAIVLVISTSLTIQGFREEVSPVVSILALDVSKSSLDNTDWHIETLCDRYQQYLQPRDYQAHIWFADKARVIEDKKVAWPRNQYTCRPTSKALARHEIGRSGGTFLHKAVLRISDALQEIPATHSDDPVLVIVILHELDRVTPSDDSVVLSDDFGALAKEMGELAEAVGWIRILGPSGETATRLRQLLRPIPNARFCLLNNAEQDMDECLRSVFEEARKLTRKA